MCELEPHLNIAARHTHADGASRGQPQGLAWLGLRLGFGLGLGLGLGLGFGLGLGLGFGRGGGGCEAGGDCKAVALGVILR